jgi:protein-S-isoprenylcysteine O-methyltransferase Ste14
MSEQDASDAEGREDSEARETTERGAAVRFPPPLVPLIAIAVGWGTDSLAGSIIPSSIDRTSGLVAGGILLALGLALVLSAMQLFRHSGQDPAPWKSTPEIIGGGVYRWTRNPMYLGMGVLQAGIGLLAGNLLIVALVPVTWFVIYLIAIRHEEAYLEKKFGSSYLNYKESVRRWI